MNVWKPANIKEDNTKGSRAVVDFRLKEIADNGLSRTISYIRVHVDCNDKTKIYDAIGVAMKTVCDLGNKNQEVLIDDIRFFEPRYHNIFIDNWDN